MPKSKLHIVIIGTRGVPAAYGGFETFAEEVAKEFIALGHEVTVYGRRKFFEKYSGPKEFEGIKIRVVPTLMHKYFETVLSAAFSFLDLFIRKYDLVLLCNAANSPFAFLVRLRGLPLVINVDGIERNRSKWNMLGRLWYRLGEFCSSKFASRIVADADCIADYYLKNHRVDSAVIRYGARVEKLPSSKVLKEFNLKPDNYILYVSRLEPENNALGVVQAYTKLATDIPLVIVGDAPYAEEYKQKLKEAANESVVFTGFQFGEAYKELRSNCKFYVQATEVGGTHPALVEGVCYNNCVVANDVPEHREVLGDAGLYYSKNDFDELSEQMQMLLDSPEKIKEYQDLTVEQAKQFDWGEIAREYLECFQEVS